MKPKTSHRLGHGEESVLLAKYFGWPCKGQMDRSEPEPLTMVRNRVFIHRGR